MPNWSTEPRVAAGLGSRILAIEYFVDSPKRNLNQQVSETPAEPGAEVVEVKTRKTLSAVGIGA